MNTATSTLCSLVLATGVWTTIPVSADDTTQSEEKRIEREDRTGEAHRPDQEASRRRDPHPAERANAPEPRRDSGKQASTKDGRVREADDSKRSEKARPGEPLEAPQQPAPLRRQLDPNRIERVPVEARPIETEVTDTGAALSGRNLEAEPVRAAAEETEADGPTETGAERELRMRIVKRLQARRDLSGAAKMVSITVDGHSATLRGQVPTQWESYVVTRVARETPGVQRVVNELRARNQPTSEVTLGVSP